MELDYNVEDFGNGAIEWRKNPEFSIKDIVLQINKILEKGETPVAKLRGSLSRIMMVDDFQYNMDTDKNISKYLAVDLASGPDLTIVWLFDITTKQWKIFNLHDKDFVDTYRKMSGELIFGVKQLVAPNGALFCDRFSGVICIDWKLKSKRYIR